MGTWTVYETPGHAPSHVVLHQPERRLLISGDHVLGRISLYFDHGWTPDPVGEFLASLDRVDGLDVRLTLSGHGRPFTDLPGHVRGNRELIARAAGRDPGRPARAAPRRPPSRSLPAVYGEDYAPQMSAWLLTKMLCYLDHLERRGEVRRLRASRSAGRPLPRLHRPMRIDERMAAGRRARPSPSSSSRRARTRASATSAARWPSCRALAPTFVSVTYGAGGQHRRRSARRSTSSRTSSATTGWRAMAHFTCVGATVAELRETLDTMRDAGIENVLALRGDPPRGQTTWTADRGRARATRAS